MQSFWKRASSVRTGVHSEQSEGYIVPVIVQVKVTKGPETIIRRKQVSAVRGRLDCGYVTIPGR